MAGYTKEEYDAQYSIRSEREWGHPSTRAEVRIGYQRAAMVDYINPRWDLLVSYLGLLSTDVVVLAGAGFGWAIDHIETLLPGIKVVGVDISDYIDSQKDTDDATEIDEYIVAGGLDPSTGRGGQIKAKYHTPGPKATVVVLKEDMKTNQSRNRVRQALGNNTPTYVITEDMIQQFTDSEIADWVTELDKLTTTAKIHIITNEMDRTVEDINALTGHRVLLVGAVIDKDVGS